MQITVNDDFMGLVGTLQLIFIILKLCKVITWSWLWVLSPMWILIAVLIIITIILGLL